ncbi:MAG: recombinase family protein [Sediminibacterium sp.]|nr:recombinase family protein [Sediminibacterium sp.]
METNVVLYIRVSTDEQRDKGFSLPAQESKLRDFCKKKNWNILEIFSDDFSAKNGFVRPGYIKLKEFLKKNRKQIEFLLFTQWSRFSRNATESYREIAELNKMGIEANAIEQWSNSGIPEDGYMRAINLIGPQIENERLSLRTKDGMRQALRQGRWLWKAPYGYINDTITKTIYPNPQNRDILIFIFSTFETGAYTMEEVRRMAIEKGFPLSKQSFIDLLSNSLYAGLIPEKDDKKRIVANHKGIHEPLISEETFYNVQLILKGKRKPYQGKTSNDCFPLKENLICPNCNKLMTGSTSKGNGGLYSYYHCQRKYGCKTSFKADYANQLFEEQLGKLQVKKEVLELYNLILEDVFKVGDIDREKERSNIEAQIKNIERQMENLDDKMLSGSLPLERYNRLYDTLEANKNDLVLRHATLGKANSEFKSYVNYACTLLTDVKGFYSKASLKGKQKMIGSIYPEKIIFDGKKYRTENINKVFSVLANMDKGFKKNSPANFARLSTLAPPV